MEDSQFDRDVQAMTAAYQRAHRPDPIEAFAAAVSRRAPQKRASRIDGAAMIREGQAGLRAIAEDRAARERRNGPTARRAFDLWQKARAVYAEESGGYEFEPTLQPVIAASMYISPGVTRIW